MSNNSCVYAQYTIQLHERAKYQLLLKEKGIPTAVHYPTLLPDQPAINNFLISNDLEHAQKASSMVMSLPMHPYLTEEDQNYIVSSLQEIL